MRNKVPNVCCYACSRPRPCICGNFLSQPGEGLGDLVQKIKNLRSKSLELQESLQLLMDKQVRENCTLSASLVCFFHSLVRWQSNFVILQIIQETQQLELGLLRSKAQEARVASRRAEIRLRSLNAKYRPAEFDASLGLARVTLSSAIEHVSIVQSTLMASGSILYLTPKS